eukprot:scaffold8694_cov101-Isochrysis_galbana.AAC.3
MPGARPTVPDTLRQWALCCPLSGRRAHTYQSRLGKGAHSTYRASSSSGSRNRRAHTLVDYSTHPRYSPGQGGGPPDPAD